MPSIITASTASNTALNFSADTSGVLEIRTGSSPTTALTIDASQNATFANVINGNGSGITSINAANVSSGVLAQARGGTGTTTGYYGFKNRIINGAMVIDQRNAGASVTPANGSVTYTLDRWAFFVNQASKLTTQQSSVVPAGFKNSMLVTSSSAYSVSASDRFICFQAIEGLNVSDLDWGTANAKTVTLSFWVRSSLTGTFGGAIQNNGSTRSYVFSYTINSANTWEQKTITIAGDTAGTWLTTNGVGLYVVLSLGDGSTSLANAGAWYGALYDGATGQTNLVGTNGATFYITGVQLEVGSTATSFDYRPYGTELALCQRYYEKNFNQTTAPQQGIGPSGQSYGGGLNAFSNNSARPARIRFAVTKRTNPTITFFRPAAAQGGTVDGLWSWYTSGGVWLSSTSTTVTDGVAQDNEFAVEMGSSGAFAVNASYLFGGMWTASAEL